MDIQPQEIDTFISEKVEVEVKEGDTVDTAKITNLVTKETPTFEGTIKSLKDEIAKLEINKANVVSHYTEQIKSFDDEIKRVTDLINKYTPEVEAKIASTKP